MQWATPTDGGSARVEFAKPTHGFTPHGAFEGRSLEELVQDPDGRASLAAHIPHALMHEQHAQ
jgi:hypothetical protein